MVENGLEPGVEVTVKLSPGRGRTDDNPLPTQPGEAPAAGGAPPRPPEYKIIQWEHMDPKKFVMTSLCGSLVVRALLYPSIVVKTHLMTQPPGVTIYTSASDTYLKIFRRDGVRGLYRGFPVYACNAVSGSAYITTYETTRHYCHARLGLSPPVQSLIGGMMASLAGQTLTVPVDIVSQHMMMIGRQDKPQGHSIGGQQVGRSTSVWTVAGMVYRTYGIRGMYRGYFSSLMTYSSSSALWWLFYHMYAGYAREVVTAVWVPQLLIQCVCGPLAGATSAFLTNPLDVIRARMQVEGNRSGLAELRMLTKAEGLMRALSRGVTARMFNSLFSSLILTLFYEVNKRICLKPEYRDHFHL